MREQELEKPKARARLKVKAGESEAPELESITVRGARAHNLKNIDVTLPRDRFVVITGPSGSGKSSLAFDTIYAEGQRRYVESLSTYARQFLDQMSKPDVESISGLSPTISIEQKTIHSNPRSTVGTVTEVYDYLRLLFARIGKPSCWKCGKPIQSQTPQQMVDRIVSLPAETRVSLLAPVVRGRKGEYQKELQQLRQRGFVRVRIDGEVLDLSETISLDKNKKHDIEVYVDRIVIKGDLSLIAARLSDSVELALKLGEGLLILETQQGSKKSESLLSQKFACLDCHVNYPSPEPRTFSFNSPMGACPKCDGLGLEVQDEQEEEDEEEGEASLESRPEVQMIREHRAQSLPCPECNGARLKKESLFFKIADRNIAELCRMPVSELVDWVKDLKLLEREQLISSRILKEILERSQFLAQVGVGYLTLDRSAQTLSGGEAQRIRLATQIGSSLTGVIYVLDEPSIGLHQRDNEKLIGTLTQLRDLGNTVLVVEHDQETIEKADWVVDLGPGAGTHGGEVMASGPLEAILKNKKSLTGRYLRGELKIAIPEKRRLVRQGHRIRVQGARQNNLKSVTAEFPLGTLTCVTGVSGSGKSTLVMDTLYLALASKLYRVDAGDLLVDSIDGIEQIDKVVVIDQSPIGRTPRSNPATYTGLFSLIRDLFARLPEAQIRGFSPGRFSFNVKGGRCEACEGGGATRVQMHFLPDVYVLCETCQGKRYHRDTLAIRYKGKNIAEVLDLTAADALPFFDAIPQIKSKLTIMNDVGLGYVHLGQAATTLSGGEAQRIKLCKELSRRGTGKTVYILDEPSTGLHFDDVQKLISILQALVDQGNTVIVIEHHLDIIKVADHVIDLGPTGGGGGGRIIATGTPEQVSRVTQSATGEFLKRVLN